MQMLISRAASTRSAAHPVCACASRDRAHHFHLQHSGNAKVAPVVRPQRPSWSLWTLPCGKR
eukprot:1458747-Alexandrium_andersonii.AAC.1